MNSTSRRTMAPTIDPNAWASKMAQAKARAAELKAARRSEDNSYDAPPPPRSSSSGLHSRSGNSADGYASAAPVAAAHPPSYSYGGGAPPVAAAAQSSYRGRVVFNDDGVAAAAPPPSFSGMQPAANSAYDAMHSMPPAPAAVASSAEADYFASGLRGDGGGGSRARGSAASGRAGAKKPEWNSDFSGGMDDAPSASDDAPPPMSTKERLARMRGEMGAVPPTAPSVARAYAGIVPPAAATRSAAERKENDPYGGLGGGTANMGEFSRGGADDFGGGAAPGQGSFADAMAPRNGPALSRTGLKASVRKPGSAPAARTSMGGGGGGAGAGGHSAAPSGRVSLGGASSSRYPAPSLPPMPPPSYGNDDEPAGAAVRNAAAYGNDDEPIGGAKSGGGYKIDWDSLGPDALPPGASQSGGGSMGAPPMRPMRAPASSQPPAALSRPTPSSYPAPEYDAPAGGAVAGGLSLLKSKIRAGSAGSQRSRESDAPSGSYTLPNVPQASSRSSASGTTPRLAPPPEETDGGSLSPCNTCGRKFNEKALDKHERICESVFQNKRRAYDSKAHIVPEEARKVASSGGGGGSRKAAARAAASAPVTVGPAPTQWESKSNQLRDAMRAAREYKAAVAGGVDVRSLPTVPSAPDPSLVPCSNCGRSFSATAAERHLPKCAGIKNKPSMLKKGSGGNAVSAPAQSMGSSMRPPSGYGASGGGRQSLGGGGAYASIPPVPGMDAYDRNIRAAPPARPMSYDDMPVGRAAPPMSGAGGGYAARSVRPGGRL